MAENSLPAARSIQKVPTGIAGLDEITQGGLPARRVSLVCGGPGCGKTVLAMEFLVNGILQHGEPGLFVSFEESPGNLIENFRPFGFDLETLIKNKQLKILHVDIAGANLLEAGEFSLDGLLVMLEHAIKSTGARRLAMDTMETIFSSLSNTENLRIEVAKLFRWLGDQGVTTIITGERGKEQLTRHGFEEYVSDFVLLLDHRIDKQISKRRLRVIKYRGSNHGKDEYPFLVSNHGFLAFPLTSLMLDYAMSLERVSSGVPDIDAMLDGRGYFKGSTVMISGTAGTGKSTLAAAFAAAACERGESCLYLAFEESSGQLCRNMASVGIDLGKWMERGLLTLSSNRPTLFGLEEHLMQIQDMVDRHKPSCVIIDPMSNFLSAGSGAEVKSMLLRIIGNLKAHGITLLLTSLTRGSKITDETDAKASSLVDTWIALDLEEKNHLHRREIHIIKSRGMEHSRQTRELMFSSSGLAVRDLAPG